MVENTIHKRRIVRLKAFLDEMKNKGFGSYASIERKFGVSASFLSQIMNGTRAFGESAARTMEDKFGLSQMYFDDGSFLSDAEVEILHSRGSEFNLELEYFAFDVHEKNEFCRSYQSHTVICSTVVSRSFFKGKDFDFDGFVIIRNNDNSMSPYINNNDEVGINSLNCEIRDGSIYAICIDDDLMFRQVFREAGGALRLHSFNTDYPDRIFTKDQLDSIRIIGKQVYRAG